jgi:hypothetical protein
MLASGQGRYELRFQQAEQSDLVGEKDPVRSRHQRHSRAATTAEANLNPNPFGSSQAFVSILYFSVKS